MDKFIEIDDGVFVNPAFIAKVVNNEYGASITTCYGETITVTKTDGLSELIR